MRTLVLGGARSGKSAFAEALVGAGSCRYIATARPYGDGDFDADFQRRISQHVQRRPSHWATEDRADLCEVFSPSICGSTQNILCLSTTSAPGLLI